MPKLAIYVPKKDMREIEKWRKQINFSRVFMKALTEEIRDRSRNVKAGKGKVAKAAQYYKRKLVEGAGALVDCGHALGSNQVFECRLTPDAIVRLVEMNHADASLAELVSTVEAASGRDRQAIEALVKKNACDDNSHPAWQEAAYRGYVRGVAAAWQQVCEEMRGDGVPD